jgi:hypothetical protein
LTPNQEQPEKRAKTGGRGKGTPNKVAARVRELFAGVIEDAWDDSPEGQAARLLLIKQIRSLEINDRIFQLVLGYAAGAVPKAIEHTHKGKLTLEELVTGVTKNADEDDD